MDRYRPDLTEREHEVLLLLQSWLTHTEIADKLFVSVNTVKSHARSIYWKLGVSCRREAVEVARRHSLLGGMVYVLVSAQAGDDEADRDVRRKMTDKLGRGYVVGPVVGRMRLRDDGAVVGVGGDAGAAEDVDSDGSGVTD